MKKYNRALDYTVLALAELQNGKPVLAARLLAKAGEQDDLSVAIATIEASNAHAFKMEAAAAKSRLEASFPEEEGDEDGDEDGETVEAADSEDDLQGDPLEQVADFTPEFEEDGEEADDAPAAQMAKVLSKMVRRSR